MRKLKKRQPAIMGPSQTRDHFQKPFSNQERIEILERQTQQLFRVIGEVNNRLIALCRGKIDADVLAKFMLEDMDNSSYMREVDQAIDRLIEEKNAARNAPMAEEDIATKADEVAAEPLPVAAQ